MNAAHSCSHYLQLNNIRLLVLTVGVARLCLCVQHGLHWPLLSAAKTRSCFSRALFLSLLSVGCAALPLCYRFVCVAVTAVLRTELNTERFSGMNRGIGLNCSAGENIDVLPTAAGRFYGICFSGCCSDRRRTMIFRLNWMRRFECDVFYFSFECSWFLFHRHSTERFLIMFQFCSLQLIRIPLLLYAIDKNRITATHFKDHQQIAYFNITPEKIVRNENFPSLLINRNKIIFNFSNCEHQIFQPNIVASTQPEEREKKAPTRH